MEDDVKKIDSSATSPVTEEQVAPEEVENVESEELVDTQPTSEADVDKEVSGEDKVDSPDSKWENEKKSMSGKISSLERERNELSQAKQMLDALNSAAANDPEFMKIANKKLVEQGLLDESVLEQLEAAPQQKNADGEVINPAVKWAQAKMQEEQKEREKFFIDFEDNHPDLKEGDPTIVRANRSAIGAVAAKRIAEGNSMKDAYELAYKAVMSPNQLVEEGKLQGLAQAQGASPTEGAASGGSAKSSGTIELTPEQKDVARRFGITEEEYAKSLEE